MTAEQVEAMVAAQMEKPLPRWWLSETPREGRRTITPGRAAEVVKTKCGRVWRKGFR